MSVLPLGSAAARAFGRGDATAGVYVRPAARRRRASRAPCSTTDTKPGPPCSVTSRSRRASRRSARGRRRGHADHRGAPAGTPPGDGLERDAHARAAGCARTAAGADDQPLPAPHEPARNLGGAAVRRRGNGLPAGAPEHRQVPVAGGCAEPGGEVTAGGRPEARAHRPSTAVRGLGAARVHGLGRDHAFAEQQVGGGRRRGAHQQQGKGKRERRHTYSLGPSPRVRQRSPDTTRR